MTITYHKLTSGSITVPTTYQGQLWQLLCQFECKVGGTPDTAIYDDGKQDSNPSLAHNSTIGVGFNLRAQLLPVMRAYFNNPNFDDPKTSINYAQDQKLFVSLSSIMAKSWDSSVKGNVAALTQEVVNVINAYYVDIAAPGTPPQNITHINSFSLTLPQTQAAFTTISANFENIVSGYDNIPLSKERLALMSLEWNSMGSPKDGKNLLGTGLYQALINSDRAEAWFQIRYDSNGGGSGNTGIAKRRGARTGSGSLPPASPPHCLKPPSK